MQISHRHEICGDPIQPDTGVLVELTQPGAVVLGRTDPVSYWSTVMNLPSLVVECWVNLPVLELG